MSQHSLTSDVVIACIEAFFPYLQQQAVIVVEPVDIHTTDALQAQLEEWQQRQIEIL